MQPEEEKRSQMEILKKVLRYLMRYRFFILLSVFLAAFSAILMLYLPILAGRAIDLASGKGRVDFRGITKILERIAGIVIAASVSQWLMNAINNRITFRVVRDVRNDAFSHLQILPFEYIDGHPHGEVVSRVIADVDQFSDGMLMGFTQLFTGIVTIIGTLCFMFYLNVRVALLVVILTPLSLVVARVIAGRSFSLFRQQSEARAAQTGLVDEVIGNLTVVKAFEQETQMEERFAVLNDDLTRISVKATFFSSLTNPATRFINAIVYAAVTFFGALTVLSGQLSVGTLSAFLAYCTQYTKPFNEVAGVVAELQNAIACAGRVFSLIEEEPQKKEAEDAVVLPEQVEGHVEVKDVSFSYVKDRELIQHFNLVVKPGQRIAIVGPTGCGKSTMINLLMRFYDVDQGSILVDGSDIREVTRKSLRGSYGMVLQETWLREGSIRENLTLGRSGITEEMIVEAAKKTRAHDFIRRMEKGYDTVIEEDGGNLSQGQKQLLCITRVMIHVPSMLILDEATSSIDTRTELQVQDAFLKMMEGRTSFIVAHRLSTIQGADLILVMKDGRILEQGNHETLLAKNGFYARLCQAI